MSGTSRVINASDIATALGGPGAPGQVIGTDGTTPQWVDNPTTQKTLMQVTSNGSFITAPAGSMISAITITELNGVSVSISIGTSLGGSDVLPATPIAGGTMLALPTTSFDPAGVAFKTATNLYFSSSNWGGASIRVEGYFNVA